MFPRMLIMYRHCGAIGGNSDHRDPLINESQDQESMDREVRTSRDWVGLIGRIIIVLATRWRTASYWRHVGGLICRMKITERHRGAFNGNSCGTCWFVVNLLLLSVRFVGSLEVVSSVRVVRSLVTLAVVFSLTSWPASLYVVC